MRARTVVARLRVLLAATVGPTFYWDARFVADGLRALVADLEAEGGTNRTPVDPLAMPDVAPPSAGRFAPFHAPEATHRPPARQAELPGIRAPWES